jgi:hypothetical protein
MLEDVENLIIGAFSKLPNCAGDKMEKSREILCNFMKYFAEDFANEALLMLYVITILFFTINTIISINLVK